MPEVFVVRLSFSISMNSRTVFPSAMHHYGARKSHRMFGSLVINFVCVQTIIAALDVCMLRVRAFIYLFGAIVK